MPTQICIFEDDHFSRLLPLAYFHPVYDLKCGIFTLQEKIQHAYGAGSVALHCRKYLADVLRLRNPKIQVNDCTPKDLLLINGRVIADEKFARAVPLKGMEIRSTQPAARLLRPAFPLRRRPAGAADCPKFFLSPISKESKE